jgi:hypothetical protein
MTYLNIDVRQILNLQFLAWVRRALPRVAQDRHRRVLPLPLFKILKLQGIVLPSAYLVTAL